jgi:ParB family chromosome partitioning protein
MTKTAFTQRTIPLDEIVPNASQPRKTFDPKQLEELAESILMNGLAQAITVRPIESGEEGSRYEIVMGERRWRAHKLLVEKGHEAYAFVRCNVREMDARTRDMLALLENMMRADVSPLEESNAFQRMIDLGETAESLARQLGRPLWRIEERLRLQKLDPEIRKLCEGGFDHHVAQEIARLPTHSEQRRLTKLWNAGTIKGFAALKAAVGAILDKATRSDMFGDAPKVSDEEVETIRGMEARIERMAALAAAGWKDGQCVVAVKVSRDRARLMADKMAAMRSALFAMESQLRAAAAQAEIVLEVAA